MSDRRIHRVRIVNARLRPELRPRVSDHAMARYMARALNVPVSPDHFKEARKALVCKAVEDAIMYGASAAVVDGLKIVLEGRTVVTVLGKDMRLKHSDKVKLKTLERLNELFPIGDDA